MTNTLTSDSILFGVSGRSDSGTQHNGPNHFALHNEYTVSRRLQLSSQCRRMFKYIVIKIFDFFIVIDFQKSNNQDKKIAHPRHPSTQ